MKWKVLHLERQLPCSDLKVGAMVSGCETGKRMISSGATVLNGEGLICHETPDEGIISECESLGKLLAAV